MSKREQQNKCIDMNQLIEGKRMPVTIDLFAGAGGITEGFRQAGYRCIFANDYDEEARHTFTYNHPSIPYLMKDVKALTLYDIESTIGAPIGEVDVITGGPPCQGFSLAGMRLANDPRNALFKEFVRLTDAIKPKVIFFENVAGIMSMQKGMVLQAILKEFGSLGYKCEYSVVNASSFGVPQARPRFVLLGVRGMDKVVSFPSPTHGVPTAQRELFEEPLQPIVSTWEALSDLPCVDQGEGSEEMPHGGRPRNSYQLAREGCRHPGTLYNHRAIRHSETIQHRFSLIPQGCTNAVLPPEIRTKKQNVFRLSGKDPSRTVTCNFRTDLLHPEMNRGLTVREAARLQSFDDDYCFFGNLTRKAKFLTQDDQVGNAVPPLLARAFAEHIKTRLLSQFE